METGTQIQLRTSSELPAIPNAESLAEIRLNEKEFPHYRNIPAAKRQEWLAFEMIVLAQLARIRDFDGKNSIMMAKALDDMMMQHEIISDLTFPEIADAFNGGVFGLYGEFFGISAPNLYGFLFEYLKSEKKRDSAEMVSKKKSELYQEKLKAEREARQAAIRAEIEEAKRKGEFIPTGKVWFTPKKVNDAMRESKEHREMVRQQAREILNKK